MTYQLLNCLFDIVPPMLSQEMPFAVTGVARCSIPVFSFDIAAVLTEFTQPKQKVEKKRGSRD